MNVNKVLTKDYENISNWTLCENKPNTNPIKPNFKGKKKCCGVCPEDFCERKQAKRGIDVNEQA